MSLARIATVLMSFAIVALSNAHADPVAADEERPLAVKAQAQQQAAVFRDHPSETSVTFRRNTQFPRYQDAENTGAIPVVGGRRA